MESLPKITLIVATYNAVEWLEKVLYGYSVQNYKDFEIIVADDGSTEETKHLIEKFKQDGFLVKKKFFDENEISEIRKWVYRYMEKKPEDWENGKEMAYYETSLDNDSRILTRLENFIDYDKNF